MSLHDDEAPGTGDDDEELFDEADGADAEDGDENKLAGDDDGDDEGGGDEEDRAPSASQRAIEKLALDAGWKPKDKWKGEGWVPADVFLTNAAKSAARARRESRELQERMDRLEQSEIKARDRAFAQIEAKKKELIREAAKKGGDKAAELIEEIEEVAEEEKAKLKAQEPGEVKLTRLDKQFFADHDWLVADETFEDEDEAEEADEAFELVQATLKACAKRGDDAVTAYEKAERALKKAFPHRYRDEEDDEERPRGKGKSAKPTRRAPDISGGRRTIDDDAGGAGRLAAKLPPEAQRAGKEYVQRKIYGSLEEYAEVYFEEKKKERRA